MSAVPSQPGRALAVLVLTVLTGACNTLPSDPELWPAYAIPEGSIFYLNRDLTVLPPALFGSGSVHFQEGRIVRDLSVKPYDDNCLWSMPERSSEAVIVESDAFVVEKVDFGRSYVMRPQEPLLLASAEPLPLLLAQQGDGGPSFLSENSITFHLYSDYQGSGYRLMCRIWDDYTGSQFMTVASVRAILGDFFSLQLTLPPAAAEEDAKEASERTRESADTARVLARL